MGPGNRVQAPVEVYSPTARALHWATVGLVVVQVPVGLLMAYRGNVLDIWDALTNVLYAAHKLVGVILLVVVLWRLFYRLTRGSPADEPTIEPWQRVVSHLNHWSLYALLIAAPIAGYIGISLFPALDLFGPISLPAVTSPDKEAAMTAFAVHKVLVILLVLMIAMHVGAALFHYVIRRDNVLGRMIPRLLRRPGETPTGRPNPD